MSGHAAQRARPLWPEVLMEGAELGLFMLSASTFALLLEHPDSPIGTALPNPVLRRALMGVAMGLTAIALVYSRMGRRSGAHMNPAVTLAFARLGRVTAPDAAAYVAGQFGGGLAGMAVAQAVFGRRLGHPTVHHVATVPGPGGEAVAFGVEVLISGVLFLVVLRVSSSRFERFTGMVAGSLVALWILLAAPHSGMSMNPARTLSSAVFAGEYRGLWIYVTAPFAGMLTAAEVWRRSPAGRAEGCAKLRHSEDVPCRFCGHEPDRGG